MTRKAALLLILRIGVSVVLLVLLFRWVEIDFDELWPDDTAAVVWLLVAIGFMIASQVLASMRWLQVCRAVSLEASPVRLFWHTMAGQFLSNFVPTTIGGDVVRVARLGRDTGDRPTAFTTVVLERLSGWMVLPASIFAGLLLDPELRSLGAATRAALIAGVITVVALGVIILAAGNDFTGRLLDRYEGPLAWLHAVHEGLDGLRERPRQIVRILGTGALYQLILIGSFFAAGKSIGIENFGIRAALAFIPAVLIVQVLPLGIGGLGVREGALALFLGALDVPEAQAVALGLTFYAITLIVSLLGLPALVFGARAGADDVELVPGAQVDTSSP